MFAKYCKQLDCSNLVEVMYTMYVCATSQRSFLFKYMLWIEFRNLDFCCRTIVRHQWKVVEGPCKATSTQLYNRIIFVPPGLLQKWWLPSLKVKQTSWIMIHWKFNMLSSKLFFIDGSHTKDIGKHTDTYGSLATEVGSQLPTTRNSHENNRVFPKWKDRFPTSNFQGTW